ncbi:gliding motility-associated C-terminal domain-containing protein [Pontibacter akesuensis]|uniref:gliding motility-associated C-terminal domain-containing protein n=1 Tax=Pontibacter akesuensis TaxID=388950 RepID=UPI0015608A1C|nr:gliding motility-associated C-terminal domain-containing protein [Pontibacter akesuensis]
MLTATEGRSYKWSTGATTRSITVSQSGIYSVEVVDVNGCTGKSDDLEVSVATKLNRPKIEYTDPLIVCQQGSLKLSIPEQEGASYVWKKDGIPVSSESNEFTATEAGVYTVELSNFCGLVTSSNRVEFKILEPIASFEVQAAGSLVFCTGGSVTLSVPEYKDVTYAWFRNGNPIAGNTRTLVAKEAGTYTAQITNLCGTYSSSSNGQRVELLNLPVKPVAQNVTGCTKSALTLTASGGSPGMYRWYTSASGGTPVGNEAVFTTPVLSESTSYYVAITNGECESERVRVQANINTKPAAPEIKASGALEFCEGGSVKLSVTANSNLSYTWLRNGQEISGGANTLDVNQSGEYALTVQNDCGSTLSSNKIKVNVKPAPAAPQVQDMSVCGPGSLTLTARGGANGEYRWYDNATTATALAGATDATFTTPALQNSRTYYVSLVRNGCESSRVPVQALVFPVPQAVASVQDIEIQSGESTRLLGSGGANYSWSPALGLDNPTSATPTATPEQTTRYTLTVKNEEGCQDTTSVVVTVRQLLVIPNAFSPNGDGVNDTWEIENIEYFPDAKVEIYNRWGTLVYERTNYRGEWNGTYRNAPLPVSTYFYLITIPGKSKFTGYLNIVN